MKMVLFERSDLVDVWINPAFVVSVEVATWDSRIVKGSEFHEITSDVKTTDGRTIRVRGLDRDVVKALVIGIESPEDLCWYDKNMKRCAFPGPADVVADSP